MAGIIRLLPEAVANQIAAGEVVQRPASVVKELLENSLDAGATRINLVVKEGGKSLIQVLDNGVGMSAEDAVLCFSRHATSKITQSDDLFKLRTMGFRGEALAAIASVAQVELRTRKAEAELGTLIRNEGSDIKEQEAISCPVGTNILVRNLFYNVPARRNFLKGHQVEFNHIVNAFVQIALAHPHLALSLHHNDQEIHDLKPGKLLQRIVDLFGKNYQGYCGLLQEDTPYLKVHGYVGSPASARKRPDNYFFINNRYFRSSLLNHAVVSAYEGLLPAETAPFYVLFLEMDPKHIDVNVHPTKTEIKFDDDRGVYRLLQAAVRRALSVHSFAPSLDFEHNINFGMAPVFEEEGAAKPLNPLFDPKVSSAFFAPSPSERERNNLKNWQDLYQGFDQGKESRESASNPEPVVVPMAPSLTFESKLSQRADIERQSESRFVVQLHGKYILSQVKSGLMLIDQQAAHERILMDRYLNQLEAQRMGAQQLLFPLTLHLGLAEYALVKDLNEELHALQFHFEDLADQSIRLTGVPADLPSGEEERVFLTLLASFRDELPQQRTDYRERLARTLAKRMALRAGTYLPQEALGDFIDQLFSTGLPHFAPDGRPTLRILGLDQLNAFFENESGFGAMGLGA